MIYPSVRYEGGECFAAWFPDVMSVPVPCRHLSYHWNGEQVDRIRVLDEGDTVYRLVW